MKEIHISKESAQFFTEQCRGEHTGHMAMIPNNPTLHGFCKAYGVKTDCDFACFLRSVADALTEGKEF